MLAGVTAWARADARLIAAVGALVLVALVMRTFELGERALHHDESLHALFSYNFAQGKGYAHDPLMHGPLQFHILGLLFKLFGASDALSRVAAAVSGSALVAMPLLLRRYVGARGVLAMAVLLTISPSLLYYSRFARNEAFVAVETLLLAVAIWRYREEGGMRWLVAIAVAVALEFATKETAFLISAVFLLYVNGALTGVLVDRLQLEERQRLGRSLVLFPIAWLIAATLADLRSALRRGRTSPRGGPDGRAGHAGAALPRGRDPAAAGRARCHAGGQHRSAWWAGCWSAR